jgi:hypothetical protein
MDEANRPNIHQLRPQPSLDTFFDEKHPIGIAALRFSPAVVSPTPALARTTHSRVSRHDDQIRPGLPSGVDTTAKGAFNPYDLFAGLPFSDDRPDVRRRDGDLC